ncbi:MAG: hypothetical protein IT515_11870 [Burkholderiales bacterium]|nr:hypothetical protein [Burkholderiales bacterium]
MSNGDPLRVGMTQPPDNRATSATMLVHNGSPFGTQTSAFWVQRLGAPAGSAAIRGDNFSTGLDSTGTKAGVLGMAPASPQAVGVLGATSGPPNLFWGETGVLGVTNSFGVVGRALTGVILDDDNQFVSATGVVGQCNDGVGVHGVATTGWGVIGQSNSRTGVAGRSASGAGVEARSQQGDALVASTQTGVGVLADSVRNSAVLGRSRDATAIEGVTKQGLAGVHGQADRMYGVWGTSVQGIGVMGVSPTNALVGRSTGSAGAAIGVVGSCDAGQGVMGDSVSGIGVGGRSLRGWAGYFGGNVVVRGGFYVVGGPKAAAVKHADGTLRSLFCVESPESYFEDFGEITFAKASVTVKLDKDFASLIKRNRYQVFLSCYGPESLYVRRRGPDSFEIARVDERAGAMLRKVRVGYRIVARRADVKAERLPRIKVAPMVAAVTKLEPPKIKQVKSGKNAVAVSAPEVLPRAPKIPSVDLKALAQARPKGAAAKRKR